MTGPASCARKLGDTPALFTALAGLSRYHGVSGDIKRASELGEEIFAIAQSSPGDRDATGGLSNSWAAPCLPWAGCGKRETFWERGVALYDPAEHERHAYRFGHDPAAIFHGYLILTLWLLGYPDQAAAQSQRLRDLIQSWSHPTSLAYAHCLLAIGACLRRDAQAARRDAEEAIRLGQSYGLPSWTAMATALRGWALVEQGRAAEGLAQSKRGHHRVAGQRLRAFSALFPGLAGGILFEGAQAGRMGPLPWRPPRRSCRMAETPTGWRRWIGCKGNCCGPRAEMETKWRPISARLWRRPAGRRPGCWSCAQP